MNIEYELFKKSTFNYPNLIKYGFIKELNGYKYEKIRRFTFFTKKFSKINC